MKVHWVNGIEGEKKAALNWLRVVSVKDSDRPVLEVINTLMAQES